MMNVIRWIRRKPVAALTTVYTVLVAMVGALTTTHLLSNEVIGVLSGIVAVLAAILGAVTHKHTTSLADPKDANGTPLAPKW